MPATPRRCRPTTAWVLLALAGLCPAAATANPPRDELLRYVPDDVGFCLVVQDLRGRLADLSGSPFAARWLRSPQGAALVASPEWRQLVQLERILARQYGVGWAGLRDDVLGDAFLFAYRPGPPGRPDEEQGMFLVRGRDEKALAGLVDKLNLVQKGTGEVKALEGREHRGVKYVRRQEAKGASYYLLRGGVLLFTAQEALLRQAVDCERAAGARPSLARRLEELRLDDALLALAINPRAWDAEVDAKEDAGGKSFAACWKALQGVGLGLWLDRDVRLELTVKARGEELPGPLRRFFQAGNRPSELWASMPDNALVAVGGRLDLAALYEAAGLFLPRARQRELEGDLERTLGAMLGKGLVKEVLPAVGPDWGLCLTAPPAEGRQWAPDLWLAVRLAQGDESDPIDQAVLSTLLSWVRVALWAHNKQHPGQPLTLRTASADGLRVRSLHGEGVFPPGVQPAFALRAGFLILAGSPSVLARVKPSPAAVGAEGPVPLLRVSLRDWRAYLKERREPLAAAVASKEGVKKERALAKIDELRAGLELFDRVELRQLLGQPGLVTFRLTLEPAAPLRR